MSAFEQHTPSACALAHAHMSASTHPRAQTRTRTRAAACASRGRAWAAVFGNVLTWVLASVQAMASPLPAQIEVLAADAQSETLRVQAEGLSDAGLRVRVLFPPGYDPQAAIGYATLYVNDGQDAEAVRLRGTLDALAADGSIRAPLVIAIDMPPERMAAYGFSDPATGRSLPATTRHGAVGRDAHAYAEWLAGRLVPTIDGRYRTRAHPSARAILGWSLGGAQALNMGWHYPEVFAHTGAFSPSLWLSDAPEDADADADADADTRLRARIAQRMIGAGTYRPGSRWFLAVGTAEEADDRDGDGLIDVVDDARDLLEGWRVEGEDTPRAKGLRQLGHSVNLDHAGAPDRADAALYVLEDGVHRQESWAAMLPVFLRWAYAVHAPPLQATGRTESWQAFPSAHVAARNVDVWLPPSYGEDPQRRYPVLYMHDGQNLFDPALSYTGTDWDVDGAMTRLIESGAIREAIVIGVWNTPLRFAEYMPKAPIPGELVGSGIEGRPIGRRDEVRSDDYLRFLVEELKPFVDARYRTLPGRDDTLVMGSSMGGLISLYAAARHPQVFGGVGAVSTHWPACDGCMIDWLRAELPAPGAHRIYYDYGTATLDALYPPFQTRMDAAMRERGYREGEDWVTRRFDGAEHNEAAWKARLDVPLRFLLGGAREAD